MHCDDVITITSINGIAGAIDRYVVTIGTSGNLVSVAANSDDIISVTSINLIAGTVDRDMVIVGTGYDTIGVAANCNDVCTIAGIDGTAAAIDCDAVITAASGDMITAAKRDFIVAAANAGNGYVTSGAEVEFARRCSVDRAAGAFYMHDTGGIHCNRIVGREVEFAA